MEDKKLIQYDGDTLRNIFGQTIKGIKTNKNRAQFAAAFSQFSSCFQVVNIIEYVKSGRFYGYDFMLKKNRLFTIEELNALFYAMTDSQEFELLHFMLEYNYETLQKLLDAISNSYYK